MIEMIETTISLPGYTLDEQIYEGTRTRVYRGSHLTDSIPVVVKILRHEYPSFTELIQFRNQYAIAKQLNLPGVVKPYSLEPYRNGYALVMEDVGGVSLGSTSAISSLEDFLQIAIQLAEILNGIHRHSIVHKDIKPANILINPNTKQVYLIDFSIASQLPKETPELQNPNVLEGTLAYISPEQTGRMNRGIDYRSDLYSLGVTFYELLAGRLPFISEDPMELVHCHIAKIAPFVIRHPSSVICEEIPSVISEIVMKLMAKNAEDRYQSALGLKYDLQTCLYQLKETGKIENFEIGKRDLCDRFLIPEKLYGREREVEILLQAFERIAAAEEDEKTPNSKSELMLISGFSGIGKTVVVNEVHKPMARRTRVANVRQKGYFIKGKFDQFNRNIPFSAFVQAFRDLMKQLLSESEDCLDLWKSRILAALGDNGQAIVEVIPELESIVGKQPTVPELSGSASQSRFNLLLQKFVRVFASFEHPLVLFLDDLQWADSASLNLMQLLLSDAEMGYFLTIGAYRDNEVFPGHPLAIAIDKMQKANVRIETITLMPLAIEDTNHLIADTLKCDADLARPLTELVYRKTQGNPFFTTQFLKSLHDEGWIVFDCDRRYWQCDIARVRSLSLTDDVVEFMALQLQKLPEETLDILKLAACIGNRFDLETLAIVCEKSEAKISANLWKALKDGLIVPQDEVYKFYQDAAEHPEFLSLEESRLTSMTISYKFIHDRVQQAAYFLIPEDEKSIAHLKIGKQLLKTYNLEQQDDRIFEIVSQLNSGRSLVTDRQELDELAHLNSIAGQKAKLSTAYTAAIEYLTVGVESLSETSWQDCYSLTLSLYENLAESAYLNGDLDRLERYSILIFEKTIDILDKIKIYEIKIQALVAQNKLQKAVRLGLQILNQLEINLAVSPTQDEVFSELQQTQTLLADRTTQELLDLALMKDQSQLAAMKILLSIAAAAYISVPNLYLLIVFKLIELSLHYGNANSSIYAYAAYGLLLCGVIGDIEMGVQFGQLAIDLLERLEAKELTAKTFVLVDGFIKHWKHHTQETLPTLLEGYEAGLNTGDLEFSAYCIFLHFYHCYLVGQNLESLEKEMNTYDQIMRKINQNTTRNWHQAYWQAVLNLTQDLNNGSQLIGTAYDETLKLEIYQKSQEKSGLFHLYFNKLILSYLFNEHELAIENAEKARQYLEGVVALVAVPTFCFYDAIAQLSIARNCSKLEREKIIKHVTKTQENLKKWASHAPLNHLQKYHIVEAELHRVCDRKLEAMELYDRAIYTAKENGYIQEEALANELAAKFYLEWGKEKIAQTYLIESYYCYARWGAKAKLYHLEKQYPQLISAIIDRPQSETPTKISETMPLAQTISIESFGTKSILDLNSILKVSQAISEEIDLEKLLVGLMRVVIENSGTQHGKIVLKQDKNWVIEARARQNINTSDLQIDVLQSIPIENSSNLPQSILYYVIHTQETLVLDLNSARTQFAADPYFLDRQPQSILCLPIVKQGQLIGILYLENQLTAGVFTSDRIEVLKLLVSQAAISIENARLYAKLSRAKERLEEHAQTLETKVEERTTALQQTIDCLEREMHDRQQAETLLRESEQYHRQLFEQSPIGLALCDLQGNLVYVNSAYAEIIGRTVEETLSLSYWQITPEKYAADEAIQLQNLQETGRYGPYEKEYIHQDGHLVPVCLSGILVRKDGKQLIWSSVEDITERKVTEQALQHSKQQLEDAQKLAHIGNWHFDLSTGTITWSDEAFRIHQQPTEQPEPSYSEFLEILHPDDRESLHTAVTNAIERGESYDIEYRLNIANGNLRYVNAKGEAIVNESGQIVALFGTVLDITDRKTADEKLLKQEQFLRSIYDGAEQALFVIDVMPEGELRYGGFNPIAERYGGVTTEQIEGKTPEQAFGLEVGSYLRQKYEQCLQAGTAIFYEEHLQFEERELWTLTSLSPLKDTQGKIYRLIGTANDITVRKRQEEALQLIVEGTTARTGEDFFRTFVRYLAQALQIRYALIAKVDRRNDRYIATTLAFWAGEDWGDNIEYDLTGTPCAQVYEIGTLCRYPCAVQPLFPDDPYLEMLNAESYVGIPVVDTGGNLQGLVAVLDTEPMDRDLDMQSSILEIFAARAGAEIERMRSEEALRQSQIQLQQQAQRERLLNSVTDRIRSSLDFETILASAVGEIRNFLQVDRCHFAWYYHETPDPYWQVVSESREPGLPDFTGCYPVAAFGPLSEMVIRQDVLRFDDVEGIDDPTVRDYVRSLGNQSMLVIPMQSYLGRIGILACIHSQAVRPWCEEELELLQAMMGQLAIALNQAELYTQSCNKAMELEQTLSELQRTQAQLVQSEKMSSLGQMVAGVAHEINNPVSFIAGNVHHAQEYFEDLLDLVMLYQEELPQPSLKLQEKLEELDLEFLMKDLQKLLKSMKIGSDRIRQIVLSLRNFSRLDESDMKEVDLHEGIENTLLILQHRLKESDKMPAIEIEKQYKNLPPIACYPSQLNQVFMNILSNAIDALEDAHQQGKTIFPKIQIRTEITDRQTVKIAIADNGGGMTESIRQKLFDPFFTTKPVGKGTGLGLSISYSIVVDKHGGQLTCHSLLGKGTEFTIEIPQQQLSKMQTWRSTNL